MSLRRAVLSAEIYLVNELVGAKRTAPFDYIAHEKAKNTSVGQEYFSWGNLLKSRFLHNDFLHGGPFGWEPVDIPGTIQAEKFDTGGAGVAYFDTSAGNAGKV